MLRSVEFRSAIICILSAYLGKDVLLKLGAPSTWNWSSQPEMLVTALFRLCLEHVGRSGGEHSDLFGV